MARNASVQNVLQEKDFDAVWNFLESKFGYSKKWRVECYEYVYSEHPYHSGAVYYFIFFCQMKIQPLLNAALLRNEHHPTFLGLLRWMFKDRFE